MTRPAGLAHPRLEQPVPLAGATASFLAQRDLRSRSITVYGQTLARLARYAGPDTPLAQLGPADLQAFMDTWYAGAAAATWNLNLAALRSFYRYALRQHLVADDPSAAIERRRLRRDPDRQVIPARQLESLWHRADLPVRRKRCGGCCMTPRPAPVRHIRDRRTLVQPQTGADVAGDHAGNLTRPGKIA